MVVGLETVQVSMRRKMPGRFSSCATSLDTQEAQSSGVTTFPTQWTHVVGGTLVTPSVVVAAQEVTCSKTASARHATVERLADIGEARSAPLVV